MSNVTLSNQQLIIDHQPTIIIAAEFHYFRTPKSAWKERLLLLKENGFNTIATYIPWLWHESVQGQFDLTGITHPEKDLAGFLDLVSELGFMIIARPGPYIMAETINEGIPSWVFERYPQIAVLDQRGHHHNVYSYNHPLVMSLIEAWYKAVFSVLSPRQWGQNGKIILVQLDNEMGMIAWVRNAIDLNDATLERFTRWMNERYPQNTPLHSKEIKQALCDPKTNEDTSVLREYQRFYRDDLKTYTLHLWSIAQSCGLKVPPVINIHGFGDMGRSFPIGMSQLFSVMQIKGMMSATDVYPLRLDEGNAHQIELINALMLAVQNPDQPLFSIEFQAGGNTDFSGSQSSMTDLHTRLSLFHQMKAFNHYLFMDGENHPSLSPHIRHDWGHPVRKDGSVRSHFHRYGQLNAAIQAYGHVLVNGKVRPLTTVGFLIDDYMSDVHSPLTQKEDAHIKHQRNDIQFDGISRYLSLDNIPFNAVELLRQPFSPQTHSSLWVMMDHRMPASVQSKLVEYVSLGGKLLLMGRLPQKDECGKPCFILSQKIGVTSTFAYEPFSMVPIHGLNYDHIPASFVEYVLGEGWTSLLRTSEGQTVGFEKVIGKGKVVVVCAAIGTHTLDDLDVMRQLAQKLDVKPRYTASSWISIRTLHSKQGQLVLLNNYQDDPWEGKVFYRNKSLFGGKKITVPARSGVILPLNWRISDNVTLVWSTSEVRSIKFTRRGVTLHFSNSGMIKVRHHFSSKSSSQNYIIDASNTIKI